MQRRRKALESRNTVIEDKEKGRSKGKCKTTNCVVRFSVLLKVGEGLNPKLKRGLKLKVLERVRKAFVS